MLLKFLFRFPSVFYQAIKQDFYAWANYLTYRSCHQASRIIKYKNLHQNETVFVLGSGPSLALENLKLLEGKVVVSYNASYMALLKIPLKAHYSCVGGSRMNLLRGLDRGNFDASFRCIGAYRGKIDKGAIHKEDIVIRVPVRFFLYKVTERKSGFSCDLCKYILNGGAGSGLFYAIQIAAYMGARKIVLLGADFQGGAHHSHFADFGQNQSADYIAERYAGKYIRRVRPALKEYKKELNKRSIRLINASRITVDDVLCKETLEYTVNDESFRNY